MLLILLWCTTKPDIYFDNALTPHCAVWITRQNKTQSSSSNFNPCYRLENVPGFIHNSYSTNFINPASWDRLLVHPGQAFIMIKRLLLSNVTHLSVIN